MQSKFILCALLLSALSLASTATSHPPFLPTEVSSPLPPTFPTLYPANSTTVPTDLDSPAKPTGSLSSKFFSAMLCAADSDKGVPKETSVVDGDRPWSVKVTVDCNGSSKFVLSYTCISRVSPASWFARGWMIRMKLRIAHVFEAFRYVLINFN